MTYTNSVSMKVISISGSTITVELATCNGGTFSGQYYDLSARELSGTRNNTVCNSFNRLQGSVDNVFLLNNRQTNSINAANLGLGTSGTTTVYFMAEHLKDASPHDPLTTRQLYYSQPITITAFTPFLSVSPGSFSLAYTSGSSGSVSVSSNTSWTVSSNVSWLNTSASSGSANGSFSVFTNSQNPSSSSRTGTITLSNSFGNSQTITITQAGSPAATRIISLSMPDGSDFGTISPFTGSTRRLRITNNGTGTLTVFSLSLPGNFNGSYSGTISPGSFVDVTITFASFSNGFYSGNINVSSDATGGSSSIFVSGTAVAIDRNITLSIPAGTNFGSVYTGQSVTRTLVITNNGNSPLTVFNISYPAGFSGVWTGTIAAGASQNIDVTFAPQVTTTFSGSINVNSDNTSGNNLLAVSGIGLTPVTRIISLSMPQGTDFGSVIVGQTAARTLIITNNGTGPLTINFFVLPPGFSGNFSGTIPAGGSQNVTITFTPTAGTFYSGNVIVDGNATGGSNTVAVSGTGIAATRIISLSTPQGSDFGSVNTGQTSTRTLIITNNGNSALNVS
ncbi:MAG: choice-of-anchor D domain-containing protein, partial [Bacteroidota bacterium]